MPSIRDIMTKEVITIKAGQTLKETCKVLIENKLSGVPVEDEKGALIGFVSERDILTTISKGDFLNKKAEDIMMKNVVSAKEDASIEYLSRLFTEHPFRHIPITKNKKIVGIVSRKEIVNKLMGEYY